MSQVVVVIGGGALSPRAVTDVLPDATIIAADSGLDHAVAAGLRPTVLIGDLDSIRTRKMFVRPRLESTSTPSTGRTDTKWQCPRTPRRPRLVFFGASASDSIMLWPRWRPWEIPRWGCSRRSG